MFPWIEYIFLLKKYFYIAVVAYYAASKAQLPAIYEHDLYILNATSLSRLYLHVYSFSYSFAARVVDKAAARATLSAEHEHALL